MIFRSDTFIITLDTKGMAFEKYSSRNPDELAQLIPDHINAMVAYWDKDLVCRYANDAYVDWFGKTKQQMINRIHIDELLGPLYEKNLPYITGVLSGKKQLFEREIPIPDGSGVRHSLATYFPDIANGEVLGFFVHVADVTYLKNLEKEMASAKRETLRKIIETEEAEKRYLVETLRENVNQRLTACKVLVQSDQKKEAGIPLHKDVSLYINEIITELNLLCQDLSPTEIEILGLSDAAEQYAAKLAKLHHKFIDIDFADNSIENITLKDKYSIFRILQNLITMTIDSSDVKNFKASIKYSEPDVKIIFEGDNKFLLNKSSKEYHAIVCRVDYYSGKIHEFSTGSKTVFEIEFSLTGM
jgi:PAS domain S-box-containing protein